MPYRANDERPPRRRGLVECPSCHARVRPKENGECPSCRRNVDDATDDGMRSITVADGTELPGVCARCGAETQRRVTLKPSRTGEGNSGWFRALVFLWNPILGLVLPGRQIRRIRIGHALCSGCAALNPEHVDFEQHEVTLIVHRNLHAAMIERGSQQ